MASHYKTVREPKVRVIVMLTQTEIDSIDEVGHDKMMASRSEAIRYLIKTGREVIQLQSSEDYTRRHEVTAPAEGG